MTTTEPGTAFNTAVRLLGRTARWVAFVSIGDEPEVRVRFRDSPHPTRYRCDACGRTASPECVHARIAATIGPILRRQQP